ncbi:MAG TPA: NAD(P)(+) transhydrogenase (Re/Si-specific) subunit alpha, partial [Chitinophagaceae bacterium]
MMIGLLKEPTQESRVSLLPEAVASLTKKGITIFIEKDAGLRAFAADNDYVAAGAQIKSRSEIFSTADIILAIHPPEEQEIQNINSARKIFIGVYQPLFDFIKMQRWAQRGITTFSLDMLPRTTRAQSMDVLSSQANIAGYKSVLLAAATY